MIDVYLYKVNRNLNRCIRTAFSFGIEELRLIDCGVINGNLFSAKDRVKLSEVKTLPDGRDVLYLEVSGKRELKDINIEDYKSIVIGGESVMLKPNNSNVVEIKTKNKLCLTTEAAFAVFCYEKL